MKKYNEGYALPFVLVVFLVITLAATGVLTVSLHNLKAQKASALNMQEKYGAQGEIEKAEAVINALIQDDKLTVSEGILDYGLDIPVPIEKVTVGTEIQALKLTVVSECGATRVTAVLKITGAIEESLPGIYQISNPVMVYDSFAVSAIEGGAEE